MPQIWRKRRVLEATGLSHSTLYRRIRDGSFPPPIPLGSSHAVGWLQSDVEGFIERCVRAARGTATEPQQP